MSGRQASVLPSDTGDQHCRGSSPCNLIPEDKKMREQRVRPPNLSNLASFNTSTRGAQVRITDTDAFVPCIVGPVLGLDELHGQDGAKEEYRRPGP